MLKYMMSSLLWLLWLPGGGGMRTAEEKPTSLLELGLAVPVSAALWNRKQFFKAKYKVNGVFFSSPVR